MDTLSKQQILIASKQRRCPNSKTVKETQTKETVSYQFTMQNVKGKFTSYSNLLFIKLGFRKVTSKPS